MAVFEFVDYREYLKEFIKSQPKQGWGSMSKIAEALDMTQAHVSQIVAGGKDFSVEQALRLSRDYMKLSELETEYFILLVQCERAGTEDLKKFFRQKLDALKKQASQVKTFITPSAMSDKDMLKFYSSWIYSAVRLYCSFDNGKTYEEILNRFQIAPKELVAVLEFLVDRSLIVREGIHYKLGTQRTMAPKGSMEYLANTKNWRLQSLIRCEKVNSEDLFLTSTMTLSKKDYEQFRQEILESFKKLTKQIETSPAEEMVCLTLDLFKI